MRYAFLDGIVKRMEGVTQLRDMCPTVGISWEEMKTLIIEKGNRWDVKGQDVLNIMMIGAAIGYMHAKGIRIDGDASAEDATGFPV